MLQITPRRHFVYDVMIRRCMYRAIIKSRISYLDESFVSLLYSYIEDAKNMGKTKVGNDYKNDSIDVHDVLLFIIIVCFEVYQPKNQGKELKRKETIQFEVKTAKSINATCLPSFKKICNRFIQMVI